MLRAVILAPGTVAPDLSVTVPTIVAVPVDCAQVWAASDNSMSKRSFKVKPLTWRNQKSLDSYIQVR